MLNHKFFFLILFLFCFASKGLSANQTDTLLISDITVISKDIKTKPSVIIRELTFSKGELIDWYVLSEYEIGGSIANLKNLNLFNQINIIPTRHEKTISVQIEVVEKWYLWPIPFAEFADRNFNQWSTFDFDPYRTNYGLYLFKYNLFGLNHTMKATVGTGYTKTLGFEYIAPYIDRKKRFGFTLDVRSKANNEIRYNILDNKEQFFQSDHEALVKRKSALAALIFRPGLYTRHTLTFNAVDIGIADTVTTESLNPDYLYNQMSNQQLATLGYTISYDNRNNKLFPLTGIYTTISAAITRGDMNFTTVGFDLNFYQPLPVPKLYSGLSYTYQDALNQDLPYVLNKAIGVGKNVRGYEQNLFLGDQFAIMRAELRYLILPEKLYVLKYMPLKMYKTMPLESYISLFYEQAQIIDRGLQNDIYGFGIGLNTLLYYDKVFRFEYSWNHWNNSGLKIHFKKAF